MSRPDPIQYAERLYAAIRAANFSPISFLAFGSAVKDGVDLRRMPRIAAEPFMRVVGDMLELEEEASDGDIVDVDLAPNVEVPSPASTQANTISPDASAETVPAAGSDADTTAPTSHRDGGR